MDYDDDDYGDYVASDDVSHSGNPFSFSTNRYPSKIPALLETFTDTSTSKPFEPSTFKQHTSYAKDTTRQKTLQQIDAKIAEKEARIREYEQDIYKLRGLVQLLRHDGQELRRELKHNGPDIAPQRGRGYVRFLSCLGYALHLMMWLVEAVMLTGSTAKEEKQDAMRRLRLLADGKLGPREGDAIKLCYFTVNSLHFVIIYSD